jgi:hypothetical protein
MPPYLPCCALPCSEPTQIPTPTPTCHPIAGLTDCRTDSDCVVADQIDCCPCQMGGRQGAINQSKRDELSQQLEVCCASAGVCLDVYQCEDNLKATCSSGTCVLVNTAATPTPTPKPTPNECNPLVNNCPSGTTCGCCCGAWECLTGSEVCCEIACTLPTSASTATPTPTPTSPVGICCGDCDGNAEVMVDELIALVNIDLGTLHPSACPHGVPNGAQVDISLILQAVNNALYGCGLTPTPTPQCSSVPCGGDCVICPACPPGKICNGPLCRVGVCALNPFTGCQCEPVQQETPTPPPTPVLPHGHTCCQCENNACTDFAWVEVEPVCPKGCQAFLDAGCEAPCHPGPVGGPATCVSLTPCTTDADCDDGNGCTIDECTIDGCTHVCVCD